MTGYLKSTQFFHSFLIVGQPILAAAAFQAALRRRFMLDGGLQTMSASLTSISPKKAPGNTRRASHTRDRPKESVPANLPTTTPEPARPATRPWPGETPR